MHFATNNTATRITFIDPSVPEYQALISSIQLGTEVVVLDPNRDGISQITETLAQHQNVTSIDIISHGATGELDFSSSKLNLSDLSSYTNQLQAWNQALAPHADILLYGCDIASTERGQYLIQQLAQLTGADVAASTDATGGTAIGGNWNLEYRTGNIEALGLLDTSALANYNHRLATLTVTNTNDSGAGSLRDTITNVATAGDTINFGVTGTITLTSGELLINKNLTIQGPGAGNLSISGNNASRVINIQGGTVTIDGLTITKGKAFVGGGGIYVASGSSLNLSNSTISANSAVYGGGIFNKGTAITSNSTISANSTFVGGGGGIYNRNGTATINNSTISGNSAVNNGGGIRNAGGTATINNSTISGNSAGVGGGISNYSSTVITNSTISANSAQGGGGILNFNGTVTTSNSTISANSAANYGGGILNNGGTVQVGSSIVAGNPAPTNPEVHIIGGTFTSNGNNLVGQNNNPGGFPANGTTDIVLTGAIGTAIAPLANNGGFLTGAPGSLQTIQTQALVTGSPAINKGAANGLTTDQRGTGFLRPIGASADIGAFELQTLFDIAATNANQAEGNSGTTNFTFTVTRIGNTNGTGIVSYAVTGSGANPANAADFVSNALPSGTVTFNSGDTTQVITIPVQGDSNIEPNEGFTVTITPPTGTDINTTGSATGTIQNDDTAGVTITQTGGSTDIAEGGATDTYTVVLTSQPTANVTINLTPDTQATTTPTSLTFTSTNWNTAQTVIVTAVDDAVVEGNHTGKITHTATSTDTNYNNITVASVTANITDNDTAGVTITQTGGSTDIAEGGATDTYTVVLTSQPTQDVTINLTPDSQVTTSATSLTFTSTNWNTAQTVIVTAVNDAVVEGNHTGKITHTATSTDTNYNNITVASVTANITDNDAAGITVKPTSGLVTSESGDKATFTIVLNSQPTANVTIPISSSNTKEGTVSTNSVTFTPANWNAPQTITVTGVDDNIVDGDIPYTITTGAATSTDPTYNNVNPSDVSVINKDNDSNVVLLPDLTLTKTASSQIVIGAQAVTYTLNVSNIGQAAASNITVSDALPSGLNFVTATATGGFSTPSGTDANGNLNFTGGSLAAGASATLTLVVNTSNSSSTQGFTNTATVDPLNRITESNENNNSASVSFGYIAPAAAPPIGESLPNNQPIIPPNPTPGGFVSGFFPDLPPGTFITPELQNNTGRVINGTDGNDTLTGGAGNDTIRGGRGDDTIYGYGGDNLLIGGRGNDVISGGKGNDTLIGTNANNRGTGEGDILIGNGGVNLFILGDTQSAYYDDGDNNNPGLSDYALIRDFNPSQDEIQLKSGLNYLIGNSPTGLPSGAAIFIDNDGIPGLSTNDELIGILQGVSDSNPSAIIARFQFI